MSNVRPALLVFAGSLLFLTGCGKGDVSKQIAAAGGSGILRVGFGVSPTTLDPAKVQDIETTGLLDNVFEGLVTWDEQNHLVPCLSDKWDVKDGGKTYVFHLRKGVKFHNGDPLTPEDVVFSFKRAADPTMSSPTAANYLDDIEGFGTDKLAVTVKDPDTVEIKIKAARPYILGKLTYPCAMAVSKKAVGDGKEIKDLTQMVGTGPFKGGKYTPDVDLSLDGFEQYWRGAPALKSVVYSITKDFQTRLSKFKAGELHLVGVIRNEIPGIKANTELASQLMLNPRPAVAYLAMNPLAYAPFADRRVRQAVAMAIDRKRIVDDLLHGINPGAGGILPPGIEGARKYPESSLKFDPKGAATLLAAAGFPGGKGMPDLELCFRVQTPDTKVVAEAMQQQLADIGIPVKLREMEWGSMLKDRNANKLPFMILSWYADYLDAQNFLSVLLTTGVNGNHFGYSKPKVDSLCRQADTEQDAAKRIQLYQQAEDLILQDAPWLPLYYPVDAELQSPKVKGLKRNLFGDLPFWGVSVS